MSEEKVFLISLEQLKEICSSKSPDARMSIMIDVMSKPYREKTATEAIGKGIAKTFAALEEMCTDPPKKGQVKKP